MNVIMAGRHSQHNLDINSQIQGIPDKGGKRQAGQQALMRIFSTSQEVDVHDQSAEYERLQAEAPRWMWFLDVYLDRYKNGLLEVSITSPSFGFHCQRDSRRSTQQRKERNAKSVVS